ncbi:MAG: serine hydrolase domain-containing protein [Planctomycetota bacterium]
MNRPIQILILLLVCGVPVHAQRGARIKVSIPDFLRQEVESGSVVGAQVITGSTRTRSRKSVNLGKIGLDDSRNVSDETLFCLASCSKPIASAVVFSLLDSRTMKLELQAGDLIPELDAPSTGGGHMVRSPTLRELLSHRGGIYSQMQQPTKLQLSAIRDFSQTLDEATQTIAQQPLLTSPGTQYAYSGAGYVLVGAMAERASGKDIESLLQERICNPVGMDSTTYFPDANKFDEIAEGGKSQLRAPHTMGSDLKFPLVGGSIYSTARDVEKFARMVLTQGRANQKQILSREAWSHYVSPAFPTQRYGYGWLLTKQGTKVVALSHKGSLPPYQSTIHIDLANKTYKIAIWTLAKPNDVRSTIRVRDGIANLIKG